MNSSNQKGIELEAAVREIESTILANVPGLDQSEFTIETRKRIVSEGVRHEIDLFITVESGSGLEPTIIIFECKNWNRPVGKNEVIVFSEKLSATRSHHGFFVASQFTADAVAQARKDDRIRLLSSVQYPPGTFTLPGRFHVIAIESVEFDRQGWTYGDSPSLSEISPAAVTAFVAGQPIDYMEYLNAWEKEVEGAAMRHFPSSELPDGLYKVTKRETRRFSSGEFEVSRVAIAALQITCSVKVRVARPKVRTYFEVASRGRAITFLAEPLSFGGATFTLHGLTVTPSLSTAPALDS